MTGLIVNQYNFGPPPPWYESNALKIGGVLPVIIFDFKNDRYAIDQVEYNFADIFTFTRTGNTSRFNDLGQMETVTSGPVLDHNPFTLEKKGVRIDSPTTNLIVSPDTPADQSVTVTAQTYALTYYGTGSVSLSGAHVASVSSAGAIPNRTVYLFTATAGTLDLDFTGEVRYCNLQAGAFPKAYTPDASRGGEILRMTADYASPLSEYTIYCEGFTPDYSHTLATNILAAGYDSASIGNYSVIQRASYGSGRNSMIAAVSFSSTLGELYPSPTPPPNGKYKAGFRVKTNDGNAAVNGVAASADTSGNAPVFKRAVIGSNQPMAGSVYSNGWCQEYRVYNFGATNAQLTAVTA
jgi:hypothetical protein